MKLNKDLHNTSFALLISIYEFVCHYEILSGTAGAQIDRKHNRKSTVIMQHDLCINSREDVMLFSTNLWQEIFMGN